MTYAARIADGIVVEVVALPAGVKLADAFHPDAGFVPANKDAAVGMTYTDGEFGPAPPPPPALVPFEISRRQFFQQLAVDGTITQVEALAALRTGALPDALAAVVSEIEDASARFAAEMLLSGATTFERAHPLTERIGATKGKSSEQIDDFFRAAAAL